MTDKAAIIVVNYNNYPDTIECLASLLRLTYPSMRVVLVDNGSTNDSLVRIEEWLNASADPSFPSSPIGAYRTPAKRQRVGYRVYDVTAVDRAEAFADDRLAIVRCSVNAGFAAANNIGARLAARQGADYLWFLNNDTVVEPNTLAALVRTIASDPRRGAAGSKILQYDRPDRVQYCGGGIAHLNRTAIPFENEQDRHFDDGEIGGYITGSSILIRKDLFERIGGWDERFFMYVEDVDLSVRIRKTGSSLWFSSESRVYHKGGASVGLTVTEKCFFGRHTRRSSYESFSRSAYYDLRNWIYLNRKRLAPAAWYPYLFCYLPLFYAAVIFFIMIFDDRKTERIRIVLRAVCDGLAGKLGPDEKRAG